MTKKINSSCDELNSAVHSYSQKLHAWKQFLAFHAITFHFSSKFWFSIHACFRKFKQFHVKSCKNLLSFHSKSRKIGKIVIHRFQVSRNLWSIKSHSRQGFTFDQINKVGNTAFCLLSNLLITFLKGFPLVRAVKWFTDCVRFVF